MSVFDFFRSKSELDQNTVIKQPARRPVQKDFTESYNANTALTKGLYHNTYPGFKLAGGLAFAPIAVPVWFMGLPIPILPENDPNQVYIDEMLLKFATTLTNIHIQSHRDGTIWVWPRWTARGNKLIWEFIEDDAVTDIIKDLDTGDIVELIVSEEMKVTIGEDRTANVKRKRVFTREKITISWEGAELLPQLLRDQSSRNPLRILPIPFANNADETEFRGHSDYERIISNLKNYHDIDLAWSNFLAKFNPKLVQTVSNLSAWLGNNGAGNITDLDIANIDLIVNVGVDTEKTEILFPENAHEAYVAKLKNEYQKIVESSAVPEIAWGLKTEGNRASVEESMDVLIKFVEGKRAQKNEAYRELFAASLAILTGVDMVTMSEGLRIEWNKMDSVSDEVRSIIFRNYMQGISAAVGMAAITKDQLWKFYRMLYPDATIDDFEEFRVGLSDMGGHRQWANENYSMARDLGGEDDLSGEQDDTRPDDTDE